MIDNPKIKFSHRQRAAVVYIRQSHPSQMENHPESTARQYALVEKATALGWNRNQVITIDEDLGISGSAGLECPPLWRRKFLLQVQDLAVFSAVQDGV